MAELDSEPVVIEGGPGQIERAQGLADRSFSSATPCTHVSRVTARPPSSR
jgi:hypothetical protein